jgi:hypothetical protein
LLFIVPSLQNRFSRFWLPNAAVYGYLPYRRCSRRLQVRFSDGPGTFKLTAVTVYSTVRSPLGGSYPCARCLSKETGLLNLEMLFQRAVSITSYVRFILHDIYLYFTTSKAVPVCSWEVAVQPRATTNYLSDRKRSSSSTSWQILVMPSCCKFTLSTLGSV